MTVAFVERTAEAFWAAAGGPRGYPRNLEDPVLWTLPLAIVKLPGLRVHDAGTWLDLRGITCRLPYPDRALRAALVAYGGRGLVFLDGTDHKNEARFSLAHEVAHFLLDYLEPRRRAIELLGDGVLDVLDGRRAPTVKERFSAILQDTPVGFHAHLMARGRQGSIDDARVAQAESRANRLAMELLAPAGEVRRQAMRSVSSDRLAGKGTIVSQILVEHFGLPPSVADDYASILLASRHDFPTVRQWLGL